MNTNQPIGYWIKKADEQLTQGINRIHSSFQVSRTHWQIINTIHDKTPVNKSELINIMKPFVDQQDIEVMLIELEKKKLIVISPDNDCSLLQEGQKLYASCMERQQIFRKEVMAGISEEDYLITMSTLQNIVGNISRMNE